MALVIALGWFWAVSLLATREHQVESYGVVGFAVPVWGFLALPAWKLLSLLLVSSALAAACARVAHREGRLVGVGGRWLLVAYAVPLLDSLRALGMQVEYTFFEPLLLTGITGAAMAFLARDWPTQTEGERGTTKLATWFTRFSTRFSPRLGERIPWIVTGGLTLAACGWWYAQGCQTYDEYMLGYHDFGHFAYRVASTWEGRGFLLETPSLPAFWDHFNPGLALLAPLWGLWPDARLFLLVQAICLAAPAPLVYRIARAWGMPAASAAIWAAAYLAFPAVGQLNLNYSYGWHPISLALPLMFAAVHALLARRYGWAAALAILACSFEEAVIVALACLAAALGLQAWWVSRRGWTGERQSAADAVLAQRLPAAAWFGIWAALTIAFILIARYAAFTRYQTGRFSDLGESGIEIAMSPLLRPRAYWGQALSLDSILFLLSLLLPLTPAALRAGRMFLLAVAFPLGLLVGWDHPPAKSIAFQYVTTLLPVLFLAGIAGAQRLAGEQPGSAAARPGVPGRRDLSLGLAVLASCVVASTFLGALPWSSSTFKIARARTYQTNDGPCEENPRRPATPSHRALHEIVTMVNTKESAVLASGRIAAHLLNVRRLETVEQAIVRWDALCAEAGPDCTGSQVFDWIVLDTYERFQQSWDKMDFILADAKRAGFQQTWAQDGIVVLSRPGFDSVPICSTEIDR